MAPLPERVFAAGEEPEGDRVHRYFELELIARVISGLTEEELQRFRESQFGTLLEIDNSFAYSGKLVHFLLTRQLKIQKKHEIWFVFAGKPIRFALPDFKAVTGLCCQKVPVKPKNQPKRKSVDQGGETPFRYTLFGSEKCVNPEWIAQCLEKKLVADSDNRIRCAGLVLLYGVILPRSGGGGPLTEKEIEVVKDLDQFFNHPWGRVSFNLLMSTIKLKEPKHLAKPSIAVQGFAHAIQLVLLKAVPEIEATMPAANTVVVRLDDSDPTPQPPPQKLRKLRLDHVREVDKEEKVDVRSIVATAEDDWDSELEWSDEVSDEEASGLLDFVSEGHAFVSSEFVGGIRPGDVPVVKEPVVKAKQRKAGGGRKPARKSASGIQPPESLGFTEAQMKWIEEYVQTALKSANPAPTDPGISKENTPGKEQMGGPSTTPGKAPESSSRKRKGPPKKKNPTPKRRRSKQGTEPEPAIRDTTGEDVRTEEHGDVPRARDDDGDVQTNPDTRTDDAMEDVVTDPSEHSQEGSAEDATAADRDTARHTNPEPESRGNALGSSAPPGPSSSNAPGVSASSEHTPSPPVTIPDAPAKETTTDQPDNTHSRSIENEEATDGGTSEQHTSGHTPPPPVTDTDVPPNETTPDQMDNTPGKSVENEEPTDGCTSEQATSSHATRPDVVTQEVTPNPARPSDSAQHLSPVSPDQVINSVVSELSAHDKDIGEEGDVQGDVQGDVLGDDVQGGDSTQKAMDVLNKIGELDLGGGFTISSVSLLDALEFASPLSPWVMDAFVQLFRLKYSMLRDRFFFFQGTRFASLLGRDYTKFLKAGKAKFTFGEDILGCIPRQVSRIYFPFNFDKQAWVGLCADVPGHCLHVLDSRVSARRDVRIRNELKALAEMLPYVIKAVAAGGETRTLSVKPYTISRDHRLPQCEDLFASGVMSVMFIEAHALGGLDACFSINPESWVSYGRSYVMQLADYAV